MLQFIKVSFSYPSAPDEIFTNVSFALNQGWTGLVGPNGSGKSTLLQLAAGELFADSGQIKHSGLVGYCPQRTDSAPDLDLLFNPECYDAQIDELCRILGVEADWQQRWQSLSHGERKRAQLACVLATKPDLLLIDEPTNHLDAATAQMIRNSLARFKGTGLLVSHDRELLDGLCGSTMFVEPPEVVLFSGNYCEASAQKQLLAESLLGQREKIKQQVKHLDREMKRRQAEAARSDKRVSKKHLHKNDSDGRARINLAKLTSKDAVSGDLAAGFASRLDRAQKQLQQVQVKKEYDLIFDLQAERCRRDLVLRAGATKLALGSERSLEVPEIKIAPGDRIGVVGENGAGKSTLIRYLLDCCDIPDERLIYLPQEIPAEQSLEIIKEIRQLPGKEMGEVFSFVSCLGSSPARLLDTDLPSPGEMRKLLFALGLTRKPWLIIMDEPTNHLDLPAIELLEGALAQIPCALLLVSHDSCFLSHLVTRYFTCEKSGRLLIS